jgi:integrase
VAPTSRSVEELAASYLSSINTEVKARTFAGYEACIRAYILPVLGATRVSRLTTDDIRGFKRHLLDREVAGGKLMAVSTAREAMSRLHDMINFAMDGTDCREYWGLSFDPWPRKRFNWPDERERPAPLTYVPYTVEETRRFIAGTPATWSPHVLSAILLMLRDGELRAMRWKNLDEKNGLYFVRETQSRSHGFTTTKTASSEAEVPVPAILMDELRQHRKRQAELQLKQGSKWQDQGLIFTTVKGTAMPHQCYCKSLKQEAADGAGVRSVSLHTLRKTGASILESLGVSRAETQVALRHKRPTVTDDYVAVYMEQRRRNIEEVARLVTQTLPSPQSSLKVG